MLCILAFPTAAHFMATVNHYLEKATSMFDEMVNNNKTMIKLILFEVKLYGGQLKFLTRSKRGK